MLERLKKIDFSTHYPLVLTFVFIIILFQYSFATLEFIFYDMRVQSDLGISYRDNIVLIAQDEESDEYLGESYPYSYFGHQKILERLRKDSPQAIYYLVDFEEPNGEDEGFVGFKNEIDKYVEDGGTFRFGTSMDSWGEQLPPQDLRIFGHSLALINVDERDNVSRRVILELSGEDSLYLWAANQYRSFLGLEKLKASKIFGSYYHREADAYFGMFRYFGNPTDDKIEVKTLPFHRVRVGNFSPGLFKDKIVIIGPKYVADRTNYVLTPYNTEKFKTSKLSLTATMIKALIQNKTVYQLPRYYSYIISIIIALLLSFSISKLDPAKGLLITIGVIIAIIASVYLLYSIVGIWVYLSHIILTVIVVYYIWVPFRAIGEYQRRFAIQEETKILKKVEHLKQNFISLMSHDLKTPVAKIAGLADIILTNRESKDTERNLIAIVESTKELNRFISSILDLTKVESKSLNINTVSKDVNNLIEQTVKDLHFEAKNKSISVESDLSPLYPIQLDIELMRRVLGNLVENAIKYSERSSAIKVKSWDDKDWVYIVIEDNGPGIPHGDLEHIFEKFYRVKNDASHTIKGSGLGLYLVKYFIELQGGTILAESEISVGTKFTVKLKNA